MDVFNIIENINICPDNIGLEFRYYSNRKSLSETFSIKNDPEFLNLYIQEADIYQKKGYLNREIYLKSLADEFEIEEEIVNQLSSFFGESEDFDGLITALEDYVY